MGIIPPLVFIIYLAHIDVNTKTIYRRIVSASTSGEYFHHSEELSILLRRCEFTLESFKAFDTSFASVGKVTKIETKIFLNFRDTTIFYFLGLCDSFGLCRHFASVCYSRNEE